MVVKHKQSRSMSTRQRNSHEPTLPTIRMVEKLMKKRQIVSSRNQLFKALPKQVMHETLKKILSYLEDSNKIIINNDGSMAWIFVESIERKKSKSKKNEIGKSCG